MKLKILFLLLLFFLFSLPFVFSDPCTLGCQSEYGCPPTGYCAYCRPSNCLSGENPYSDGDAYCEERWGINYICCCPGGEDITSDPCRQWDNHCEECLVGMGTGPGTCGYCKSNNQCLKGDDFPTGPTMGSCPNLDEGWVWWNDGKRDGKDICPGQSVSTTISTSTSIGDSTTEKISVTCGTHRIEIPKGKFFYVNQDNLVMCLFDDGELRYKLEVTTGRDGTNTEAFKEVELKEYKGTHYYTKFDCYADNTWVWQGGYFIHGPPYTKKDGEKEYMELDTFGRCRASHGCVRMSVEDIKTFTDWVNEADDIKQVKGSASGPPIKSPDCSTGEPKSTLEYLQNNPKTKESINEILSDNRISGKLVVVELGHESAHRERELTNKIGDWIIDIIEELGGNTVRVDRKDKLNYEFDELVMVGLDPKVNAIIANHINAAGDPAAKGLIVFYGQENDKKLAEYVVETVKEITEMQDARTAHESRSQWSWLTAPSATYPESPGILVEYGFITNTRDRTLLDDEEFRRLAGFSVIYGLNEYWKNHPTRWRVENKVRVEDNRDAEIINHYHEMCGYPKPTNINLQMKFDLTELWYNCHKCVDLDANYKLALQGTKLDPNNIVKKSCEVAVAFRTTQKQFDLGERGTFETQGCGKGLYILSGKPIPITIGKLESSTIETPDTTDKGKIVALLICFDPLAVKRTTMYVV